MRTLLIEDRPKGGPELRVLLRERCGGALEEKSKLQAAIEALDVEEKKFDLIVCDYRGGSHALLACFLRVSSECPCVLLVSDDEDISELLLISRNAILETVSHSEIPVGLNQVLSRMSESLGETLGRDDDFVRIETADLTLKQPLWADVYLRLAPDRYCRRFKKEDGFDGADLDAAFRKKGVTELYLRKDQASIFFENQMERLDSLVHEREVEPLAAKHALTANLSIVHDVVNRIGFTPEVQELTKKTVNLALKAIGNSPALSPILTRLRKHQGKYITSHSLMLAEVSCAVAQRVGWGEPSVFMKLCFAAFLHDLALSDNVLAQFRTLVELREAGFGSEAVHVFRLHPIKAAEYASQFTGIPSDVDIILLQHHEQPDGGGFPRGLHHQQIYPMAGIFIIAHDLLHFFIDQVPTNDREDMLPLFLERNAMRYRDGLFAKIRSSLETGEPVMG